MNTPRWIVCKSFLDKCPPQKRQALLQYVSPSDRDALRHLPKPFQDPSEMSEDASDVLNRIHPSWFSSFLRAYTETEIVLFLSALPENFADKLRRELFFTKPLQKLPEFTKKYLQDLLLHTLFEFSSAPLPRGLLPESPLNPLLSLYPDEMQTVIELLSMQDLGFEMRLVIDNSKLKGIQNILSNVEKTYLRSLSLQKQTLSFGKAFLQEWDGEEESLRKHLLHRGMNRFAKACYGMSPDFLWYIQHELEIDKSKLFTKLCVKQQNPQIVEILIAQILDIVSYLKNSKTSRSL